MTLHSLPVIEIDPPDDPFIFCSRCATEVERGALRCKGCGAPFKGKSCAHRLTPKVSYGSGPIVIDEDTGVLTSGDIALTLGIVPDDQDTVE